MNKMRRIYSRKVRKLFIQICFRSSRLALALRCGFAVLTQRRNY